MTEVSQMVNEKATKESYLVKYRITKAGKSYIIGETLFKPIVLILLNVC